MMSQVYKFNITARITSIILGLSGIAFLGLIIKINLIDKVYGEPTISSYIILFFLCCLCVVFSSTFLLAPFNCRLIISDDGIEYHTVSLTFKALWHESRFNNRFLGRNGLLTSLDPEIRFKKVACYLGAAGNQKGKGIPIKLFGRLNSKELVANIQTHAPYLFGFILSETDYVETLDALDKLVITYMNDKTKSEIFYDRYGNFCLRYVVNGEKTVRDFHTLSRKYVNRLALHLTIFNEIFSNGLDQKLSSQEAGVIIKDHFLLNEIFQRYKQ